MPIGESSAQHLLRPLHLRAAATTRLSVVAAAAAAEAAASDNRKCSLTGGVDVLIF